MAVSIWTFILVVVFGSCSWLGTNSVWMQLPLLTSHLPEGWNLPSYLAADVQIACVGPLLVSLLHRLCPSVSLPKAPIIVGFIVLACVCQLSLALWWDTVARIGSGNFSVCLYVFLFGLAFVDSVSNVLFLPFMAQYNPAYLNAYFVGMGLSALIPSLLSLVQGTSNYKCVEQDGKIVPEYLPPRFQASIFFFIIFFWTCVTGIAFILLYRSGAHKNDSSERVHEGTPLNDKESTSGSPTKSNEDKEQTTETEIVSSPTERVDSPYIGPSYVFLLLCTALVNAQMNGIIPSIQSYAALPYSQSTYHYGLTFANIVSPICSFLPIYLNIRSLPILAALTVLSSCITGFIIYLAALSPHLIFNSVTGGSAVSIAAVIMAAACHSYLRVIFASLLREGQQSASRLFWCGVFIQIGSFLGSVVMFPLVNIFKLFTPAPTCKS